LPQRDIFKLGVDLIFVQNSNKKVSLAQPKIVWCWWFENNCANCLFLYTFIIR